MYGECVKDIDKIISLYIANVISITDYVFLTSCKTKKTERNRGQSLDTKHNDVEVKQGIKGSDWNERNKIKVL